MVNTNIQAPVPLTGPGFVAKRKGNYNNGEFRQLVNAESTVDGIIANRRSILATGNAGFAMVDPFPFIGYIDDFSILASATTHMAVSEDSNVTLWAPTGLPVPAGGYHKLVGAFKYNKINYWLTIEYNPTGPVYNLCLYSSVKTDISTIIFADLTRTVIITGASFPVVSNYFIHKERLFVVTETAVYFSKATDPKIFAVPDGGFFSLADTSIKYAFALSDTIYILADNSVSVFSYSIDPNEDGYIRTISNTVGGEWGCSHQSSPYLVNKSGIYSINNLNVEKVHETEFDVGDNIFQSKILSFEDYLVVIRRTAHNYAGAAVGSAAYWNNIGKVFAPGQSYNTFGYNVFFVNTKNGSTHVVDFTDSNDTAAKGYIVDAMVNPNRDFEGNYRLYFLTNKFTGGTSYKGSTYYMNPEREVFVKDQARKNDNTVTAYKPRIKIEIDSFVPDGNEYMMKKFRNLLIMAKFPSSDFGVELAYDNHTYPANAKALLINQDLTNSRPHYPARVGLNQRGRSVSIKFSTSNDATPLVGVYDQLEISDIRLFWTYTSRAPELKTLTTANQTP